MSSEKYLGMDVHQATISVAVMDSTGKVIMESWNPFWKQKPSTILESAPACQLQELIRVVAT